MLRTLPFTKSQIEKIIEKLYFKNRGSAKSLLTK